MGVSLALYSEGQGHMIDEIMRRIPEWAETVYADYGLIGAGIVVMLAVLGSYTIAFLVARNNFSLDIRKVLGFNGEENEVDGDNTSPRNSADGGGLDGRHGKQPHGQGRSRDSQ